MKPSAQFLRVLERAERDVFGFNINFTGLGADYMLLLVPGNGVPFQWEGKDHALTVLAFAYAIAKWDGQ